MTRSLVEYAGRPSITPLNTFGVKVAESWNARVSKRTGTHYAAIDFAEGTHEHNRLVGAGMALLGDQANVDVWRDLKVVPLRLVHGLRVWDETDDGADLRASLSMNERWITDAPQGHRYGHTYVP